MLRGLASSWPVSFLTREVMQTAPDYATAVALLRGSDLMAPTYITVGGSAAGEGAGGGRTAVRRRAFEISCTPPMICKLFAPAVTGSRTVLASGHSKETFLDTINLT